MNLKQYFEDVNFILQQISDAKDKARDLSIAQALASEKKATPELTAIKNELELNKSKIENYNKKLEILMQKAYENRLFEVNLIALKKELENLTQTNINLASPEFILPSRIKTKEQAKEYIYVNDLMLDFVLSANTQESDWSLLIPVEIRDIRLLDGKNVLDHISIGDKDVCASTFCDKPKQIVKVPIDEVVRDKLMINLLPASRCMQEPLVMCAMTNCIKNKEKQQKISKNTEKLPKI